MKRATNQQSLINSVFEAAERTTNDLTHLIPDLDRGVFPLFLTSN